MTKNRSEIGKIKVEIECTNCGREFTRYIKGSLEEHGKIIRAECEHCKFVGSHRIMWTSEFMEWIEA